MKFDDAFAEALKITPEENRPKGDPNIPKILAFLWTMVAVAKNKLDDIAYIDNNKQIMSIPLQKSSTKTANEKSKPVKEKVKIDGKEKKAKEPEKSEQSAN